MFQGLLLVVAIFGLATLGVAKNHPSRSFFVFGDSLVDNGNNNYLATVARADAPPYGVDYPDHLPTGRFSNGYNIPDIMCQEVGLEAPLPYLSPKLKGQKLMVGANFASAGIGILEDTGVQFAHIIRLQKQLKFFEEYKHRVSSLIGQQQTEALVNKALFLVTVGGNDFVNNYFLTPMSARRVEYNLQDFSQLLVSKFREFLQRLYALGARRVIVTGTGPIGCTPTEIALRSPNGQCAPELQRAAHIYNPMMVKMTTELNHDLGSNVFISANAMKMQYDFITNPRAYGFVKSNVACCGQGPYNGLGLCIATSNLCKNRDEYVFWDAFHPTERASRFIVKLILSGSEEYMTPMNLSTIMTLDSRA